MPFVIGLHSSLLLSLQKMPMSEVVLVDLDRDQVSILLLSSSYPPPTIRSIKKTLRLTMSKSGKRSPGRSRAAPAGASHAAEDGPRRRDGRLPPYHLHE